MATAQKGEVGEAAITDWATLATPTHTHCLLDLVGLLLAHALTAFSTVKLKRSEFIFDVCLIALGEIK